MLSPFSSAEQPVNVFSDPSLLDSLPFRSGCGVNLTIEVEMRCEKGRRLGQKIEWEDAVSRVEILEGHFRTSSVARQKCPEFALA